MGRVEWRPVKPHELALAPSGLVNVTDHDSRVVRTQGQPPLQGYNAQLVVNERQIALAAEITTESPDFGHLEPMVRATQRELRTIGLADTDVVLADAGYWHQRQIERIAGEASKSSCRPTRACAKARGRAGPAACPRLCVACSRHRAAATSTGNARSRSSPCSARSSSTARSNASNAAAEPPAAVSGD